jgi:hypothetical protein
MSNFTHNNAIDIWIKQLEFANGGPLDPIRREHILLTWAVSKHVALAELSRIVEISLNELEAKPKRKRRKTKKAS